MNTMRSAKNPPAQVPAENHPRRGHARAVADDALAQTASILGHAGFSDPNFVLRWAEIAGADVARVAVPTRLLEGADGATLTLKCEAGAAVFLQHETRALVERLNAYLGTGRITRIKLQQADMPERVEPATHPALQHGKAGAPAPAKDLSGALEQFARLRLLFRAKRDDRAD